MKSRSRIQVAAFFMPRACTSRMKVPAFFVTKQATSNALNITLLGHHDIASLYALDRLITLMPEYDYSILLSGELQQVSAGARRLDELARFDAELCSRFLDGAIRGPVAPQLTAPPPAMLTKPNSSSGRRVLRELQPDLIISVRYRRILHEAAIAIPRHGVINLHSGVLPDYRGVMATFWAMLAGEKEIGTTLHWIVDSGIDTGPILEICRRPTRPDSSYLVNVLGLYADGCNMIARAVRTVAAGQEPAVERQTAKGSYFHTPAADDVRRFEGHGMSLFDGTEEPELRV